MRSILSKFFMVPAVLLLLTISGCGNDSGTASNDPSSATVAGGAATATDEKTLYSQVVVFGANNIYTVPKRGTLSVTQSFNGFFNGALGNLRIVNSTGADLATPPPPVCTGKPGKVKDCLEKYTHKVLKPYLKKLAQNPTSIQVLINGQEVVAPGQIPRTQGVANIAVAINAVNTLQVNLTGLKGSYIQLAISSENTPPLQNPTADFSFNPTSGIVPLYVSFDASASSSPNGSISSFAWDFGDGFTESGTMNPIHLYFIAGTYSATLTVTDSAGKTDTKSSLVVVNELPDPIASFNYAVDISTGAYVLSVDASASSSGNGLGLEPYAWFWGDGSNDTGLLVQTITHTYLAPGTYNVILVIADNLGYTASQLQTVTIPPIVLP